MLDKIIEPGGRMRLKATVEDSKGRPLDVEFTTDGEVAIKFGLREVALVDAFTLRKINRLKQQAVEQFRRANAEANRTPVPA